jgi:hypothetical protein
VVCPLPNSLYSGLCRRRIELIFSQAACANAVLAFAEFIYGYQQSSRNDLIFVGRPLLSDFKDLVS